jgi:hypothetical protein
VMIRTHPHVDAASVPLEPCSTGATATGWRYLLGRVRRALHRHGCGATAATTTGKPGPLPSLLRWRREIPSVRRLRRRVWRRRSARNFGPSAAAPALRWLKDLSYRVILPSQGLLRNRVRHQRRVRAAMSHDTTAVQRCHSAALVSRSRNSHQFDIGVYANFGIDGTPATL